MSCREVAFMSNYEYFECKYKMHFKWQIIDNHIQTSSFCFFKREITRYLPSCICKLETVHLISFNRNPLLVQNCNKEMHLSEYLIAK